MANQQGEVAALPLPGDVLEPNQPLTLQQDDLSQFGHEMERPAPVQRQDAAPQNDQKRYEYWQSQATKAANELKTLQEQFKAIEPVMPLISVIQKDAELQNTVRTHLTGKKPVEAPQRPDSFNEVEAFSNPDSASFKYRVANERYKDERINQLQKQFEETQSRQQQEFDRQRQQSEVLKAQQKFQEEVLSMGIPPQELPEFYNLVQNATTKDMVEFVNWKKGRNGAQSFEVPGNGYSSRPSFNNAPSGPVDISEDILKLSREFK